jgi:hypothetical protein
MWQSGFVQMDQDLCNNIHGKCTGKVPPQGLPQLRTGLGTMELQLLSATCHRIAQPLPQDPLGNIQSRPKSTSSSGSA